MIETVKVIGAGLAGCEAALQLAERGISVKLYEMKPKKYSPAHKSENFAELVCSNSLKADRIENACGLLKEEMRHFNSVMMQAADVSRVPAGGALAVDRDEFSQFITDKVKSHTNIEIINDEVTQINPDEYTIIATGPLTSEGLSETIMELTGESGLSFYDAAAPIVTAESIDYDKVFKAARYDKGTADYINCPMTEEEYTAFYNELISAETAQLKGFENSKVFEGCMPVEVMAKRGVQTLTFGPLKPVGLTNPKTGKDDAYAVVQLRQDNSAGTLYNLVGFQTNLKWGEQKRVFSMIPGLKNAEFVRYGVMHRNTFINSPTLLNPTLQTRERKDLFFAGQITGTEGYTESIASGLLAGINMAKLLNDEPLLELPLDTMLGALTHYITNPEHDNFQPINSNWGIVPPVELPKKERKNKKLKGELMSNRALESLKQYLNK